MATITTEEKKQLEELKTEAGNASVKLELAMTKYNLATVSMKYYLMSLYRKYNLSDTDKITEEGEIIIKEEPNAKTKEDQTRVEGK